MAQMEPLFVYGRTDDGKLVKFGPYTHVVTHRPDHTKETDYSVFAHLIGFPGSRLIARLTTDGWMVAGVKFEQLEVTTYDDGSPAGGV